MCVYEEESFNIMRLFSSLKDDDYLCRYTIKKYHSEKIVSDDAQNRGGRIEGFLTDNSQPQIGGLAQGKTLQRSSC